MTEWGTHPMIEFSSLEDPEEEDERRRFRFGASKAAKIVRAINVDGLAAVIQAVADIAAGSIDRNAVEVLSLGLPGKLDESVGDGGRCLNVNGAKPDVVLNEINQYLRSVASCDREAARLLVLAKQAIRELVGQGECEPELDNHVNVHAKLGDLVAEVESLL